MTVINPSRSRWERLGFEFDQPSPTLSSALEKLTLAELHRLVDARARSILDADPDVVDWRTGRAPTPSRFGMPSTLTAILPHSRYRAHLRPAIHPNQEWGWQFVIDRAGRAGNSATVTTNRLDYQVGESVRIRVKVPGAVRPVAVSAPVRSRERITPFWTARRWSLG